MSNRLVIRPEAEAFEWYEGRRIGLGCEFLEEVNARLANITGNPTRFAVVFKGVRQVLVRRFPYKLLYVFEADKVEAIGVVHVKRRPQFWQKRV